MGLALLTFAYWRGPLTGHAIERATWINVDPFNVYFPDYSYVWSRWRAGAIPLWNPHELLGVPTVAMLQSGPFYPGHVLGLVLRPETAFAVATVLHLVLGGWFAGWYALRRGLSPPGVIATAVFATFGSDLIQRFWIAGFLFASPWIFLCLLATDALFERPSRRAAAGLAVALAIHFLAGWPQATMMAVTLLGLRAAWWLLAERGRMRAPRRTVAWLAVAVALWVMLISAQALPTLQALPESARPPEGIPAEALAESVQYTWSGLLGELVDASPTVRVKRVYFGLVGLVLFGLSWMARGRRSEVAFWFGVTVFFTLLLLGQNGPVYPLWTRLPGGTLFREPTRFMYCAHTAACLSVGFGADAAWRKLRGITTRHARLALTCLFAGLVATAMAVQLAGNHAAWLRLGVLAPYARVAYPWTMWLALCLGALAAYLWWPRPRVLSGMAIVIGAVWLTDLFYANRNLHRFVTQTPHYWLDAEQLGLRLPDGAAGPRVYLRTTWQDYELGAKWATLTGHADVGGWNVLHPMRTARFFRFAREGKPPPAWFYSVGREDIGFDPAHAELLSLLSVRWMLLRTSEAPAFAEREWPNGVPVPFVDRTTPELCDRGILLAENPDVLPRAYVVTNARVVATDDEALAAMVAPDFDPRTEVLLAAPLSPAAGAAAPSEVRLAQAVIESYAPEKIVVRVQSPTPGYLVLTDAWDPGWRATVNGAPRTIGRANVLMRAVAIPAGRSIVRFIFRPGIQYGGLALSLAGLLATVALVTGRPKRPRATIRNQPGQEREEG